MALKQGIHIALHDSAPRHFVEPRGARAPEELAARDALRVDGLALLDGTTARSRPRTTRRATTRYSRSRSGGEHSILIGAARRLRDGARLDERRDP